MPLPSRSAIRSCGRGSRRSCAARTSVAGRGGCAWSGSRSTRCRGWCACGARRWSSRRRSSRSCARWRRIRRGSSPRTSCCGRSGAFATLGSNRRRARYVRLVRRTHPGRVAIRCRVAGPSGARNSVVQGFHAWRPPEVSRHVGRIWFALRAILRRYRRRCRWRAPARHRRCHQRAAVRRCSAGGAAAR
jgi:hypothetical protein